MSSIALTKALAKEFLSEHNDLTKDSADLEEKVHDFVKRAKKSESLVVFTHLSKAIDGRKVFDSVKRRLAIRKRAKEPKREKESNSIESFASKALKAAKASKNKWHNQAYIYCAWKEMPGSITLADFKKKLIEAHKSDLLELHRADLVEAMSENLLKESATPFHNYTFHLISLD